MDMTPELGLLRSDLGDGGWSIHREDNDELILSGEATADDSAEGWDRPNAVDWQEAETLATPDCECSGCECDTKATCTDDSGVPVCGDCSSYYTDDSGVVVCSKVQGDEICRHCKHPINWGGIETGAPGQANALYGSCACEGRQWSETEQGPGQWHLGESLVDPEDDKDDQ